MAKIDCIAVLKALSEINRMRILRLLLNSRLSVSEVAKRLKITHYNVSKHLRILREAGLISMERQGKNRLCMLAPHLKTHLAENKNVLQLKCCTFRFDKLPK
ncbi:MAG: metalloregulator ArsR/SmtB family transcription factor [Lentisphaerota bacterium]